MIFSSIVCFAVTKVFKVVLIGIGRIHDCFLYY
uniref:Uncharacterized protein n=1 Tax=Arundo donax TaxID=35708 RepID=A0A0A9BG89_ARUDO